VLSFLGTRRLRREPRGLQSLLEYAVVGLTEFVTGLIGPHGRGFAPFIGSLFIFILTLNLFGLIPGMKSPTANLNTTLALALIVFCSVQFYGFLVQRWRYLMHFVGEPLWLAPLMLPMHIIGELARPVSLSFRLFANMRAKELVLLVLTTLAVPMLSLVRIGGHTVGLPIPLQLPIMGLGILLGAIQALVFALLAAVYLAGALAGFDDAH